MSSWSPTNQPTPERGVPSLPSQPLPRNPPAVKSEEQKLPAVPGLLACSLGLPCCGFPSKGFRHKLLTLHRSVTVCPFPLIATVAAAAKAIVLSDRMVRERERERERGTQATMPACLP
ncbi:hypothetical protein JDV02_005540 [Purpureocillium takamizusanense]|uniref:Uncharacterized protein n=1 Tax=Purpureocillium takamizusanense TaxID=2060973 RepID=A0A9Q8VC08_9HYPO|nr:uncharacterized protein JDV02_005540 [Purpureocillium takamizusanense]UNI19352.1 hypothetical protein JDV02_005540 [Purpureocillium takamizusanense]